MARPHLRWLLPLGGLLALASPSAPSWGHNGEDRGRPAPAPSLPTPAPRQAPALTRPLNSEDWWEVAREAWVPLRAGDPVTTGSGPAPTPARSLEAATDQEVVPALRWALDPTSGGTSREVAAAYLALGRLARRSEDVELLVRGASNREAALVEMEAALLALGLLPRSSLEREAPVDALARARRTCLSALDDDARPDRARALAALSAGLLGADHPTNRDPFAADLYRRLAGVRRASDEVPVGLLEGLGTLPSAAHDGAVAGALQRAAWTGTLDAARWGSLAQAHAALTCARIGGHAHPAPLLGLALSTRPADDVRLCAIVGLGLAAPGFIAAGRIDAARRIAPLGGPTPTLVGPILVACVRMLRADFDSPTPEGVLRSGVVEGMRAGLEATRPEDRTWAALALGLGLREAGAAEGVRLLHEARAAATRELLAQARRPSGSPDERAGALLALGLLGAEEALDDLVAVAGEAPGSAFLRGRACEALGLLGRRGRAVLEVLERAALDEGATPWLRVRATEALARLGGGRRVFEPLARELGGGAPDLRLVAAASCLGRLRDVACVEPLVRRLRAPETTSFVRAAVIAALADLCDPEPVPRLSRLADIVGQTPRSDALEFVLGY